MSKAELKTRHPRRFREEDKFGKGGKRLHSDSREAAQKLRALSHAFEDPALRADTLNYLEDFWG